eukprot:GHVU01147015.1.p2 GENE.GHVU01147015.1~~GHVU01147015.1.p2  ORF type:complete len:142 (+),score=23.79 GHVU01147015.1:744-1169(+)
MKASKPDTQTSKTVTLHNFFYTHGVDTASDSNNKNTTTTTADAALGRKRGSEIDEEAALVNVAGPTDVSSMISVNELGVERGGRGVSGGRGTTDAEATTEPHVGLKNIGLSEIIDGRGIMMRRSYKCMQPSCNMTMSAVLN